MLAINKPESWPAAKKEVEWKNLYGKKNVAKLIENIDNKIKISNLKRQNQNSPDSCKVMLMNSIQFMLLVPMICSSAFKHKEIKSIFDK